MRFIGGKSLMLERIDEVMNEHTDNDVEIVGDLFCGSAVVSRFFKQKGKKVISNDLMYMSYILARGMNELNDKPNFSGLDGLDVFEYLNGLREPLLEEEAFIYKNYSPNGECDRRYFQPQNAKKIDAIRQQIEIWYASGKLLESEYYYLLACLLSAVPYVANIAGVYAAYLKHWDQRSYKSLTIEPLNIIDSKFECEFYNMDASQLCKLKEFDLVYIDTPYNQREYIPNYHILETIAKYDSPEIKGVTGMRPYQKSKFCSKSSVRNAFVELFSNVNSKYAIVSYNTEGLLNTEEMLEVFSTYGEVKLYEYPYRRYKSKIPNHAAGLKEQLYFIKLRRNANEISKKSDELYRE